jgi:DNA modification methylase
MTDTRPSPWANRVLAHGTEPAGKLLPNDSNWRRHNLAQQRALAAAIGEVGLVADVIVNLRGSEAWGDKKNVKTLVDGHLRAALALQRGERTELPVAYVDLEPDEERLVLATLDPIGAMAEADQAKLGELLASLESQDEQVRALLESIACQQRVELPAAGGLVDPDEVPEAPDEPVTRAGDLWLLGDHRLLAGDSTKPDEVARLMAGERAVAMICDPPYLTNYQASNHPQSYANRPATKDKHWDDYIDYESSVAFYCDFLQAALDRALWERPVVYQWFGTLRSPIVFAAWAQVGLLSHWVVVWHKSRPVLGRVDFLLDYECAMYGWVKGMRPSRDRRPPANTTGVWEISCAIEDGRPEHPCPKPVSTVSRPITWHTKPGELIYEPFSGSGTAIIAAEQTGRRCYAIELSPAFVDVAVLRWQQFAGKEATLEGDGRSLAELAAERRGQPEGR